MQLFVVSPEVLFRKSYKNPRSVVGILTVEIKQPFHFIDRRGKAMGNCIFRFLKRIIAIRLFQIRRELFLDFFLERLSKSRAGEIQTSAW